VVAFDFDGTLVDSYSCLPLVWRRVGEEAGLRGEVLGRFADVAYRLEDKMEREGVWDRLRVIKSALEAVGVDFDPKSLLEVYWRERIRGTKVLPCAYEVLLMSRERGLIVACVTWDDGIPGLKRQRIALAGLYEHFHEVIIAGEDVESKSEALMKLSHKYKVPRDRVLLVDDRAECIVEVTSAGFQAILIRSRYSREGQVDVPALSSLCELMSLLGGPGEVHGGERA